MPWSNQSGGGGGWKGGNGGPWGQTPRNSGGGGPTPPDLEELLRRSQDRLKRVLPGGGRSLNPFTLVAILVIAAALIGYNFFTFRVQPDELGVVLRFGKFERQVGPGLNARWPFPVETVYTPRVTRVNRLTIGQAQDESSSASGRDIPEESLMLTGDENIVDIDFSVFWVISNAADYLFNLEDPEGSVKAAAESAMREVVGRSNIQPLLTQARQITETDVQQLIQQTLDHYASGIQITQVQLLKVDPPSEVIASFRDVQAARADQERLQNEAQTYANKVIPEARGQAAQITNAASAYRDRIIAEAQGQADRFRQVYESYRAAPDVTRQRMYIETMEQVLGGVDKVIIDSKAGGTGVIPYLPLDALNRQPAAVGGGSFPSGSSATGGAK
ncbi:MAG: FtsH protease activity modulator HflK [Bauldia sp.]|nr:MAG: FtsH protease activity modulator HflK [Bauldia sp.]